MGRPARKDADYFPFFAKDGKTLFILESKYQCKGTGFFTNVLRILTRTPEHHICIADESDRLYFFSKVKCDEESGIDMLNIMSKTGKIHPGLWDQYQVIVSQDLLNSLADAYKKRNNSIITINEIWVSYNGKEVTGDVNELKGGEKPQSKVKESKVKESKVKKTYTPVYEIILKLNEIAGTKYRHTSKKTQDQIKARFNEGFVLDDFYSVLENKKEWLSDPKMIEYYRPETLFGTKFEGYLNKKIAKKNTKYSKTTEHNIEVGKAWLKGENNETE